MAGQTFDPTKPSEHRPFDPTMGSAHVEATKPQIISISDEDLSGTSKPNLRALGEVNDEMLRRGGRARVILPPRTRPGAPTGSRPITGDRVVDTVNRLTPPPKVSMGIPLDAGDVGAIAGMVVAPEVFGPVKAAPMLLRLGARMGLAGVGGGMGRGFGEALTPEDDPRREGTPLGRAGADMLAGAAFEGVGGVVHGAQTLRKTLGAAEDLAFQRTTEGGILTPPPSVTSVAHKLLVEPFETAVLNRLVGPPRVMPADPAKDLPAVDVGQFMGKEATAGQVRSSKLLTGVESWLRSTFGGAPIAERAKASEGRLQREVEDILSPFGPAPDIRQAGQVITTPERRAIQTELNQAITAADTAHGQARAGVLQTHADEQAAADAYHGAIIRQRQAEESAARFEQDAAEASVRGDHRRYTELTGERDRLLMQAQQASEEARGIRQGIYGSAGPIRTMEEAGEVTRKIHTAVEDARDRAVDQAYAHVDTLAKEAGVTVDLGPLLGRARSVQAGTADLQGSVNPPPSVLTSRVIRGTEVPAEEGAETTARAADTMIAADPAKVRELIATGQYRTDKELMDAILQLNEVDPGAQSITFTQARRVKSDLGRIIWRNKDTNPGLAATARRYKATLEKSMQEAATAAGSEAHTALREADKLYARTKQVFEEGILADLAQKDAHQAVQYLLSRDSKEIAEVFAELGPEVQQALRSALIDATLKDPATGAWRTGKTLQSALGRIRPEVRQVMFGELNQSLGQLSTTTARGEALVGAAGRATTATEKARGEGLRSGVSAMRAEARTATAAQRTKQAQDLYQQALREVDTKAQQGLAAADVKAGEAIEKARGVAEGKEAAIDPVSAFRTLITPGTDAAKLSATRTQITEMIGPQGWAKVQARWLRDQLGEDLPGLLGRLQKYRPEVIRELIPDTALRNRLYQLARVTEHLSKAEPQVSKWVFLTHLSTLAGLGTAFTTAVLTGKPITAAGMAGTATVGATAPMVISRILADSHAGPAFVSGLRAGAERDTATAVKLAGEVARFLRREGLTGEPRLTPPPTVGGPGAGPAGAGTGAPAGRGPGGAGSAGPPTVAGPGGPPRVR